MRVIKIPVVYLARGLPGSGANLHKSSVMGFFMVQAILGEMGDFYEVMITMR